MNSHLGQQLFRLGLSFLFGSPAGFLIAVCNLIADTDQRMKVGDRVLRHKTDFTADDIPLLARIHRQKILSVQDHLVCIQL